MSPRADRQYSGTSTWRSAKREIDGDIAGRVQAAVGEIAGRDRGLILPTQELEKDLGIDSLEFVRLVQIVEDNTGALLKDEDLAGVVTVGDLIRQVEAALRGS
jgi:acyl carrier protein